VHPDLVRQIPPAVERVAQYEERGKPEAQEPEYRENRDRRGLGQERRVVAEVCDEGQVHRGDRNPPW
jgi:hypothetical protein